MLNKILSLSFAAFILSITAMSSVQLPETENYIARCPCKDRDRPRV